MTLQNDTFWNEFEARLVANGWVLVEAKRYDPTLIIGITPSGKAFTFTANGNTLTLTIAGRTRERTVNKTVWEPGDAMCTALEQSRNAFPTAQR